MSVYRNHVNCIIYMAGSICIGICIGVCMCVCMRIREGGGVYLCGIRGSGWAQKMKSGMRIGIWNRGFWNGTHTCAPPS